MRAKLKIASWNRREEEDQRMCPCTSQFMQFTPKFGYQHSVELPQSNFPDYTNSL